MWWWPHGNGILRENAVWNSCGIKHHNSLWIVLWRYRAYRGDFRTAILFRTDLSGHWNGRYERHTYGPAAAGSGTPGTDCLCVRPWGISERTVPYRTFPLPVKAGQKDGTPRGLSCGVPKDTEPVVLLLFFL